MKHAGSIAWRDIVGEVSIHFCKNDWDLVRDLVVDLDQNPLSRCNVAYASFDVREEFEALLNDVRDEPDHAGAEVEMIAESRRVVDEFDDDDLVETRDLVEAKITLWTLLDLDASA